MSLIKLIKSGKDTQAITKIDSGNWDSSYSDKKNQGNLLNICVEFDNPIVLKHLLNANGGSPNNNLDTLAEDKLGAMPIENAIELGHKDCVRVLLEHSTASKYQFPNLMNFAVLGPDQEMMRLVYKFTDKQTFSQFSGEFLSNAVEEDNQQAVAFLLNETRVSLTYRHAQHGNIWEQCLAQNSYLSLQKLLEELVERAENGEICSDETATLNFLDSANRTLLHILEDREKTKLSDYVLKKKIVLDFEDQRVDKRGRHWKDIREEKQQQQRLKMAAKGNAHEDRKARRKQANQRRQARQKAELAKEKEIEEMLKKQKVESTRRDLDQQSLNGFYCVAGVVLVLIFCYLFLKFKIEYKDKYLFGQGQKI